MSEEQTKLPGEVVCEDCKKMEAVIKADHKLLRLYMTNPQDFAAIPLGSGRIAEIKTIGELPVTLDDINVIISHLNLIKRTLRRI